MGKLLSRPKVLVAVIAFGILGVVGLMGGTLGEAFGGGFLSGPLAHIQLPAEALTEHPLMSLGPLGNFSGILRRLSVRWSNWTGNHLETSKHPGYGPPIDERHRQIVT